MHTSKIHYGLKECARYNMKTVCERSVEGVISLSKYCNHYFACHRHLCAFAFVLGIVIIVVVFVAVRSFLLPRKYRKVFLCVHALVVVSGKSFDFEFSL